MFKQLYLYYLYKLYFFTCLHLQLSDIYNNCISDINIVQRLNALNNIAQSNIKLTQIYYNIITKDENLMHFFFYNSFEIITKNIQMGNIAHYYDNIKFTKNLLL